MDANLLPQTVIRKKRDGQALTADEIQYFVEGITHQEVSEAQMAAFAMSVFLKGMAIEETAELTCAMRDSGDKLEWDLPGPLIDKHSTGGVGDMVSLMLGPIVAACGGYIPMISGRGLGHSGGTVDKLESIPGYNTQPDNTLFRQCVTDTGICIIGQTNDLAPADKKLYAVRDVTGTVESIPLITASILSKKLSEGLDGLVMDIKVGNGAFMATQEQAETLAKSIVNVASSVGVKTHALLTDMNSPLAYSVGNGLEIRELIAFLNNEDAHPGLTEVTLELAAEMLLVSGIASEHAAAYDMAKSAWKSGKAASRFQQMVTLLGGPQDLLEAPDQYLPKADYVDVVTSTSSGFVENYNTTEIGMIVVSLGGGRVLATDSLDHSVGLSDILPIGATVEEGAPLVTIHAKNKQDWQQAAERFVENITISEQPQQPPSRLVTRINSSTGAECHV